MECGKSTLPDHCNSLHWLDPNGSETWDGRCIWVKVFSCFEDEAVAQRSFCTPMGMGANGCVNPIVCDERAFQTYANDHDEFFINPECGPAPLVALGEWQRCSITDSRCQCQCDACEQYDDCPGEPEPNG